MRSHPLGKGWWWDQTWNTTGGCRPLSPGCLNCYAARCAGTLQTDTEIPLYLGTTDLKRGRYTFNGEQTVLPPWHPAWTFPLRWPGADQPVLGPGMPSLLWVADMNELFLPGRPKWALDRTIGTLVISDHIGLILTKLPCQMAAYINAQPAFVQERWRLKLWLGISAERQQEFDLRWPVMRDFAERGWLVFVSIAPMIGPVTLPDDFLSLARWVICSGEQGPLAHVRPMKASWARAVRDQCVDEGIPFFMKQVAGKKPIKPDLLIFRQFPHWRSWPTAK